MRNRLLPMLLRPFLSILLVSLFYHSAVNAEKTIDLYATDALVINQTAAVRNKAAVNELSAVFVRMSGRDDVLTIPRVREAINNASRYIYEFSYQATNQKITLAGTHYDASLLQLKFIASPLEAILREEQLPFWPASRPEVLIWMAQNTDKQRYLQKDSNLSQALSRAAKVKGLPVVRPVLDLQDRDALSVAQIWAVDERSITQAAERYNVDAIISGRILSKAGGYTANFILNHQGETQYLQASGNTQQALADNIMAEAARFFADIYAVTTDERPDQVDSERLQLVVANAEAFSVYAQVIQYLQQVKLLEGAYLASVDGKELTFNTNYGGNIAQLQQTLVLDKKLRFVTQKTVYETVVTPVKTEAINVALEPAAELGANTDVDTNQSIALPPIESDIPVQQLIFEWQ